MAALFDIGFGSAESVNQESAETVFSGRQVPALIHRAEDRVGGNAAVKSGNQPAKSILTDGGVNFVFFHDSDFSGEDRIGVAEPQDLWRSR